MENKSSVRKLIKSVEQLMEAYAENVCKIAKGETPTHPIDDKTIDTMIKIVKEMTSFEQFEKIANPDAAIKTLTEAPKKVNNIYEHVINEVKNGRSKV